MAATTPSLPASPGISVRTVIGAVRRHALAALVTGTAVVAIVMLLAGWRGRDVVLVLTASVTLAVTGWRFIRYLGHRRDYRLGGWRLADALLAREEAVSAEARVAERAALAREMHDALGHQLTLIAVRAGALEVTTGKTAPTYEQTAALRAAAADATESLNDIVAMLTDDAPMLPPETDVREIVDRAVRRVRAAGLDVRAHSDLPDSDGIGPLTLRALERLVEESLTNAVRHAPGAAVTVSVERVGPNIRLSVADTGATRVPDPSLGGGRGLVALTERLRLLGGQFAAGPAGDGFVVTAVLPIDARVGRSVLPASTLATSRRATLGRRHRRSLWTLAVAPLAVLATGALVMVSHVGIVTVASVLDPAGYRAISVGQSRAEAEDLLPPFQMLEPPADRAGHCHYHESTVSLFRRDDVYEICFAHGKVVSKRVVTAP